LSTTGTLTGASIPALPTCSPDTPSRSSTATGSVDLHPGQSLNAVIHYELKELGPHTLRCSASYYLLTQSAAVISPISSSFKGNITNQSVLHLLCCSPAGID
uniref:Trafficking protein particle complex subunit 13 N-terminal domain-containing protein n=1 Tax=Echinostoma caproni TaxID=27848 RepID=A0A183B1M9_9TREM